MAWPYEFQSLSPEERHIRRLILDRYGRYALLLTLAPAIVALGLRLATWTVGLVRRQVLGRLRGGSGSGGDRAYEAAPTSPVLKSCRVTTAQGRWAARWRRAQWWLAEDVMLLGHTYGQRDQWVGGAVWMAMLLALCVPETGRDYLHFTKRFGIVAVAQMPVQYVLVLKVVNPLAWALRSSHEHLNKWHRVLGVIVYMLLLTHAVLYLNFFSHDGGIIARLGHRTVLLGLFGIISLTLMNSTALAFVRRFSYRLFFFTHASIAFFLPPVIFVHAHAARPYMATALALLVADISVRKLTTCTVIATIERVPGPGGLMLLSVPIVQRKLVAFRKHPAAHLYMSLPWSTRGPPDAHHKCETFSVTNPLALWPYLLLEVVYNPFTVASVNEDAGDLTLVVRTRRGPLTSKLAQYAPPLAVSAATNNAKGDDGDDGDDDSIHETAPAAGTIPICIEGPYGLNTHLEALSPRHVDRVLFVAGGVGATFILPLYRALAHRSPGLKVDVVWTVRGAGDVTWAAAALGYGDDVGDAQSRGLRADRNLHIFVTGGESDSPARWLQGGRFRQSPTQEAQADGEDDDVELSSMADVDEAEPALASVVDGMGRRRPDLRQIVDDVFRHGGEDRVAVVVCGPESLVRSLRAGVAPWVHKGRAVSWHNEAFGW